jgi:hypothetical protein
VPLSRHQSLRIVTAQIDVETHFARLVGRRARETDERVLPMNMFGASLLDLWSFGL